MGQLSQTAVLQRIYMGPEGTHGRITVNGDHVAYSVELPWLDNRPNESCIPAGEYVLAYQDSPKFGHRLHVIDVPGRSHILIHKGNWQNETRGCVMVADRIGMTSGGCCGFQSKRALQLIEAALKPPGPHVLEVRNCDPYVGDRQINITGDTVLKVDATDPGNVWLSFTPVKGDSL